MWARLWLTATAAFISPQNTEIKVGSTPTAHTRKNKTKEVDFMLYSCLLYTSDAADEP